MKNRRLTILASACGLLLLSGAPALAAPGSSKKPASARDEVHHSAVRIVTYNAEYGRSPDQVVADINKLNIAGADVIGLQEMGSGTRRKAVRAQLVDCSSCDYDAFMPDTREQNAVPILYKSSKFRLLGTGTRKVSEKTYVGSSGAGPSTLKAKYVNWVLLRQRRTHRAIYVLNSHAVPSVQGGGGGRDASHPARLRLYRQHMEGLRSMIAEFEATGAPVFSTGDFNVNYRRDSVVQDKIFPYYNMSQVNVQASYTALGMPAGGTHSRGGGGGDTRLIDYVFFLNHTSVSPKAQEILRGYGSDHRPLLVRFALRR